MTAADTLRYSDGRDLRIEQVLALYHADDWSSAHKPELLHKALLASHSLVTAWDRGKLVGLGNAMIRPLPDGRWGCRFFFRYREAGRGMGSG